MSFSFASGGTWAENNQVQEILVYKGVPSENSLYSLSFESVIFSGSGWEAQEVYKRYFVLDELLKKCRISIGRISIILLETENENDLHPNVRPDPMREWVSKFPEKNGIRIYYSKGMSIGFGGLAFKKVWMGENHPAVNSIIIASEAFKEGLRISIRDQYPFIEAHELVHLLAEMGHDYSEEKNLMSANGSNGKIQKFCEKMRTSKTSNLLLKRLD